MCSNTNPLPKTATTPLDYTVLIIGAGISGIYTLYRLRQVLKFPGTIKLLETAPDVGGTWYYNRYPGARFDSESYTYQFNIPSLLEEWDWSEHFASQPEVLSYLEYFCEKFRLKEDMQFNTRVVSAKFCEEDRVWLVADGGGKQWRARWLVTAIGVLNVPTYPSIPGLSDFKGEAYHTARWPHDPVSFDGKRLGVIGTAASGIQVIQEVAKIAAKHLTVFQRSPQWATPSQNSAIHSSEMDKIRSSYPEIFKTCSETPMSFFHRPSSLATTDMSPAGREAFWENLYWKPGIGMAMSNFKDLPFDREANSLVSQYLERKIKERVKDEQVAKKLVPRDHGFGTKRPPLENGYYEVFNDKERVRLIDLNETPIRKMVENGAVIGSTDNEGAANESGDGNELVELDMLVYATGFDAITGSFDAIDFHGLGDTSLTSRWKNCPRTYLGLTVNDFPNMFMALGPHQPNGNIPRAIEYAVDWITDAIAFFEKEGITFVEAEALSVEEWTSHVHELAKGRLAGEVDSWMTGVNKNLPGKHERKVMRYVGPAPAYRERCEKVKAEGYKGFKMM
jgi:cation diffusion facilitator CzcD-associated flavoprotein CzcO